MPVSIRKIEPQDNAALADIIRRTLEDYDAVREGTVYYDESTDHLYELFQKEGSFYFVAEEDGILLGGGGVFPTPGHDAGTCELVKMYLSAAGRGRGIGRQLLEHCIEFARSAGYTQMYLESMPELHHAIKLYDKMGFTRLAAPLGQSGHYGCGIWMIRSL